MIDEKGRLFGKINIVDLLVILVVIIAAVVLGMKFLKPGGSSVAGGSAASTLMASGELLDGQVTGVEATPHADNVTVNTSGDTVAFTADKGLLDLTFTVECNVANPITTEIGTQEVRVGKSHILKTDKFELNGVVLDCTWTEITE